MSPFTTTVDNGDRALACWNPSRPMSRAAACGRAVENWASMANRRRHDSRRISALAMNCSNGIGWYLVQMPPGTEIGDAAFGGDAGAGEGQDHGGIVHEIV
jgi:hypothetical protein